MIRQICLCFIAVFVLRQTNGFLVSLNKKIIKSSAWVPSSRGTEYGFASLAVDGNKSRNQDDCFCCAVTEYTYDAWYILDLGKDFIMERLEILGREKPNVNDTLLYQHFKGMFINLTTENGTDVYTEKIEEEIYVVERNISGNIQARYVYLNLDGRNDHFVICELSVYGDCVDGQFDHDRDCNRTCHCAQGPCNKTSGICPIGTDTSDRCLPGYRNETCENVCLHGYYGQNCASTCGYCSNGETCHHINGTCTSCAPGYLTQYCNQICSPEMYGQDCVELCGQCRGGNNSCHFVDGICSNGCEAGYTGSTCKNVCPDNTYGFYCNETCGMCKDNQVCNKMTGVCPSGCQIGYKLNKCSEQCDPGTYGQDCTQICGSCSNGAACHHATGECVSCNPGYVMPYCTQICNPGNYGQACTQTCGQCLDVDYCQVTDGVCPRGCDAGYTSPTCKQTCDDYKYGYNCNMSCGNCKGGTLCNKMNGSCPSGCEPGYQYVTCSEECPDGSFGEQCRYKCGQCLDGVPCNKTTGLCAAGCGPGYTGTYCNQSCPDGVYGINCFQNCSDNCAINSTCDGETGYCRAGCKPGFIQPTCNEVLLTEGMSRTPLVVPIIGGTVGVSVILLVVVVVVCIIWRQRRSSQRKNSDNVLYEQNQSINDNDHHYDQVTMDRIGNGITVGHTTSMVNRGNDGLTGHISNTNNTTRLNDEQRNTNSQSTVVCVSSKSDLPVYENEKVRTSSDNTYRGVKVSEIWDYIMRRKADSCSMFNQDFQNLKTGLLHPCKMAMKYLSKNRYKQLYAYDHNRVSLTNAGELGCEYINASFINGFERTKKFIATQGPLNETMVDFWRMIWQYNCEQIVMLMNPVEMKTDKCSMYWPEDRPVTFGNITIKSMPVDIMKDYVVRHFVMWKTGESPRPVTQYHFTAWSDNDLPDTAWSLVNFWLQVTMDTTSTTNIVPVVTHCSTGVGSTALYIALDILYNQGRKLGTLQPFQTVDNLREQRPSMVQTKEQYVFLLEAVAEALLFGTQVIRSAQFKDVYEYIGHLDPDTKISRLQAQYKLIVQSIGGSDNSVDEVDSSYYNTKQANKLNRNLMTNFQESDFARVLGVVYIPAIPLYVSAVDGLRNFMENGKLLKIITSSSNLYLREINDKSSNITIKDYKGQRSMVLAKSPDATTMETFWSLIKEHNIKTVVMLTEMSSPNYRDCCYFGNSRKSRVQLSVREMMTDSFTERRIQYYRSEHDVNMETVTQIQYVNWTNGMDVPDDRRSMMDLLDHVIARQGCLSAQEPVLIHCSTGYFRSGLACALLNDVCRLKNDRGQINIVETVKVLKEKHSHAIPTFEQYQYLYDFIHDKVSGNVYENL